MSASDDHRAGHKQGGKKSRHCGIDRLYPTLVELCGLAKPGHLKGKSIVPLLDDPQKPSAMPRSPLPVPGENAARCERACHGRTIRTDRTRTEWGKDGEFGVELYDYQSDPGEYTNLAKRRGMKY